MLKNLEEFQEMDLLVPMSNGAKSVGRERDYTTIPRSELPIRLEEEEGEKAREMLSAASAKLETSGIAAGQRTPESSSTSPSGLPRS